MGLRFSVRQLTIEDFSRHRDFLNRDGAVVQSESFTVGCWTGDGDLVGVASFRRDPGGDGHLYGLFVAETLRGRRIGTVLLAEILETVQFFEGLDLIHAEVSSGRPGFALLAAAGFEERGSGMVLSLNRWRGK